MEISTKSRRTARFAGMFGLAFAALALLMSASPDSVKRESGYYYGAGSGDTAKIATAEAKRDLAAQALAATREKLGLKGGDIVISAETAERMALPKAKTAAKEKVAKTYNVLLKMKAEDWDKYFAAREGALRTELLPKLKELTEGKNGSVSAELAAASALLESIRASGFGDVLTESGPGSPLLTSTIERYLADRAKGLAFSVTPALGFVSKDTAYEATVALKDGSPVEKVSVRAEWSYVGLEDPVVLELVTGAGGKVAIAYPEDEGFRNKAVKLALSTNFAAAASSLAGLKKIDAAAAADFRYCYFDDVAAYFSGEALVAGGTFTVGAPARDKRASKKEAAREASVEDFYIDTAPVTNALYAMYLHDARVPEAQYPEYWDNPDYNQPDQPVIGVKHSDAVAFAAWLSERLGVVKRLPTEAEWEIAARGGQDVIYPWGDELPTDGVRANYKGNGTFDKTSPVGSFESGKNALGLVDMAGNVWQWTSTPRSGAEGYFVAKGGSWMDGPIDLRVSNRKELRADRPYVDVGIRLVREVSK